MWLKSPVQGLCAGSSVCLSRQVTARLISHSCHTRSVWIPGRVSGTEMRIFARRVNISLDQYSAVDVHARYSFELVKVSLELYFRSRSQMFQQPRERLHLRESWCFVYFVTLVFLHCNPGTVMHLYVCEREKRERKSYFSSRYLHSP